MERTLGGPASPSRQRQPCDRPVGDLNHQVGTPTSAQRPSLRRHVDRRSESSNHVSIPEVAAWISTGTVAAGGPSAVYASDPRLPAHGVTVACVDLIRVVECLRELDQPNLLLQRLDQDLRTSSSP